MKDILERIMFHAQFAQCNCPTESVDPQAHEEMCQYKVLFDAHKEIVELRKKYSDALRTIYPDRMGG